MADEKLNIFVRMKDQTEIDKLTQSLVPSKPEITGKMPQSTEDIFFLNPLNLKKKELVCEIKSNSQQIPQQGNIVIQIQVGDDKILAQPQYQVIDGHVHLDLNCDFYQLQRREDFRLKIPSSFKSQLVITHKNNQTSQFKGTIVDISSGGCRFENHRKSFPIIFNDTIKGMVQLSGRPAVEISGVIRHIAPLPDNPENDLVGVQFQDLNAQSKNRIFALIMDIHRELFSKIR